ncbi:2-hydroxycyclohexanecarboxyl-CoA dehydrogenase [Nocardia transvalensis]|uniref:3-oxoacyl-[acyl-carrier-protein] reductase MabA n=1 Tax=Nocardia transvalensis TaxID=37333 RepID=A0A7W9PKU2_9NOCA|nr:SDR family NAD(P)-dependent oxidoreductase [Nocardia transvalensis]MBB5917348.1 2-hydroxycyclohexanecarboxyl-CoA dehydrogenase [Nocardia transvalensis]
MNTPRNSRSSEPAPDRVAVVTGGASGMGASICRAFAGHGYRTAVLDIDATAAQRTADALREDGGSAIACAVDVTDRPAVEEALGKVRSEFGAVDILVTSAGAVGFAPFTEITPAEWHRIVEVNLTGTFHCVQAAIPDMVARGWGRIVTISSSSAQRGSPGMVHYTASKGAVVAMTKALAREYAAQGITVNTIPPSGIDTPMSRHSQQAGHLPDDAVMARAIPVGHLGSGDDIAAACLFLCSEQAGYITGQVLGVNGGAVI